MRYYIKYMLIAIFCGAFLAVYYIFPDELTTTTYLIKLLGMQEIDHRVTFLADTMFVNTMLLFFQMFFGVYIYKHFTTASIYFFSRRSNRQSWFLLETVKLYIYVVVYLIMAVVGALSVGGILKLSQYDSAMWGALFDYIFVYSFYLFATTLAINVISILSNSTVGFVAVESVVLSIIALFSLTSTFFREDENAHKMLKYNPFSYIVFGVHDDTYNYIYAGIFYLIISVVFIILGCIVVKKHNFIESNQEMGV